MPEGRGGSMKCAGLGLRRSLIGAAVAIAALAALGCGDPTAELLEGTATRVTVAGQKLAYETELCVDSARIMVIVADTLPERSAGLSGYAGLPDDAGMLFVLDGQQQPSFWMKDMRFSIDIIWLRAGVVVQIDADVPHPPLDTPDAQLPRYRPSEPVTHVLELSAGGAERYGIAVGSRIEPCGAGSGTPSAR